MKRKILALLAVFIICAAPLTSSSAYQATTLRNGMRGEEVRRLQQALIDRGFLKGTADGIFGNNTENAVRKFQRKNRLTADGLAGEKTRQLLFGSSSGSSQVSASAPSSAGGSASNVSNESSGTSLFGGNYSALRTGSRGDRVRTLQKALIRLSYLNGSADGSFGAKTKTAVIAFQKQKKLSMDGVAGKKTLTALEKAYQNGEQAASAPASGTAGETDETAQDSGSINPKINPPSSGSLKLLSWYDEVKPSISGGQQLLIFEPSSGLSWTLRVLSRGRHCDAEPLTSRDTRTMVKAFGGVNTWNQKGVYVKLPDGRWTVGSTHDMPHDTGSISGNDFNGHLCVHFLRTMEETRKNDPNYGVANQQTIRKLWKKLTGQEITD